MKKGICFAKQCVYRTPINKNTSYCPFGNCIYNTKSTTSNTYSNEKDTKGVESK